MKIDLISIFVILFKSVLNSQKINSGIVYYESKINSTELNKYLSIKRNK